MSKIKKIELSIQCDEDWNKMKPIERGRHCLACKKSVIDFSNYSDKQIVTFYENPQNGTTCGRFRNGQLDSLNDNLAMPIHKNEYSFLRPILAGALLTAACSSEPEMGEASIEPAKNKTEHIDDSLMVIGQGASVIQAENSDKNSNIVNSETRMASTDTSVVSEMKIVSTRKKIQEIPETIVSHRYSTVREFNYETHTAGVPLITYDEDIYHQGSIRSVDGIRAPWHKRIVFRIKYLFRRKRQ